MRRTEELEATRRIAEKRFILKILGADKYMTGKFGGSRAERRSASRRLMLLKKQILTFCKVHRAALESSLPGSAVAAGVLSLPRLARLNPPVPIEYLSGRGRMTRKNARKIAKRWIVSCREAVAAGDALMQFREQNPPPHECYICKDTFATAEGRKLHICASNSATHMWTARYMFEKKYAQPRLNYQS